MKQIKVIYFYLSLTLIILGGCDNPGQHGSRYDASFCESPYLTVINGLSESLSFIPRYGDNLIETDIQTGQSPNQIIKYKNQVYIVNSLSNSILVYNYKDFSIIHEFSTGTGTNPYKAVIADDKIYVSAYLTHQLLIFSLDGKNKEIINIEILNEGNKTFYPFPQGIANWNDYIFIACMYSEVNGVTKARDFGRAAVYKISGGRITGYIEAGAKNTNTVYVENNTLYIVSSGGYEGGFNETGIIEMIDADCVNLDSPVSIEPLVVAENNSFGAFCIYENNSYTGNLGNGSLKHYDTTDTPWSEKESKTFPGGNYGTSYLPDIKYAALTEELYVTEFNGNKLYVLDPLDLSVKKEYTCSSNNYGDAQFMLLVE